jgi:outer membrane protein OmpA-like peptidoglycan-associated protein
MSFKNQISNVESTFRGVIDDKKEEILEDKLKDKLKEMSLLDSPVEKKLTLKDLKTAPNPLSGCDASLYLGELTLFDRGSSIIKESANDKLFKVADLLKEQPSDAQYIITGHADKTGEKTKDGKVNPKGFTNNMRLSKERSKSLADWLISQKVLTEEQLDIRGVGSTEPLVDDSDLELQKVNIRVEIKRNCDLIN